MTDAELIKEADRTLASYGLAAKWPSQDKLRDLIERLTFALLAARAEQRETDARIAEDFDVRRHDGYHARVGIASAIRSGNPDPNTNT